MPQEFFRENIYWTRGVFIYYLPLPLPMKTVLVLVLVLLAVQGVEAAVISGTVYDTNLNVVTNAIVRIDSESEQVRRMISSEGTYRFTVPAGTYELTAYAEVNDVTWGANENITVTDGGEYDLDIIIDPLTPLEEIVLEINDIVEDSLFPWLFSLGTILVIFIVLSIIWYVRRKINTNETRIQKEDTYRSQVLLTLRKAGGRTTQRELCKEVPFSAAKVSLVLTELEDEDKIKKIKKGRTNVIVLK